MRAVESFVVRPRLPEALSSLQALASNLRWSWDDRSQEVFRWIDGWAWEASGHDPVRLLGMVGSDRLDALAADPSFRAFLAEVHGELRRYLAAPGWFQSRTDTPLESVGYFSPAFGLAQVVPAS